MFLLSNKKFVYFRHGKEWMDLFHIIVYNPELFPGERFNYPSSSLDFVLLLPGLW